MSFFIRVPGVGIAGDSLYFVGADSDSAYQYSMGTPYDISTATYNNIFKDISGESNKPTGMSWSNDGAKLFISDEESIVYEYDLSNPYRLDTATYNGVNGDVSGQDSTATDIIWNSNGTKFFISGASNASIFQYGVSSAFDLSSTITHNDTASIGSEDSKPKGIAWSSGGDKLIIVGGNTENIYQYTLGTSYEIGTLKYNGTLFDVSSEDSIPRDVIWNDNGHKLYMVGDSQERVYQYHVDSSYDISTASYNSIYYSVGSEDLKPGGISLDVESTTTGDRKGARLYLTGYSSKFYQYDVGASYDISTTNYEGRNYDVSSEEDFPSCIAFNDDGTKAYMIAVDNAIIHQYTLDTPYRISSANYNSVTFDISDEMGGDGAKDIEWKDDGHKFYVMGEVNTVYEYDVSSAYDLSSTVNYNNTSKNFDTQDVTMMSLTWNPDGTKLYLAGRGNNYFFQYDTSSNPYDISSSTYNGVYKDLSSQDSSIYDVTWNYDGTKLFMLGANDNNIYEYNIDTAYDLSSTLTFNDSYNIGAEEPDPKGMAWDIEAEE